MVFKKTVFLRPDLSPLFLLRISEIAFIQVGASRTKVFPCLGIEGCKWDVDALSGFCACQFVALCMMQ